MVVSGTYRRDCGRIFTVEGIPYTRDAWVTGANDSRGRYNDFQSVLDGALFGVSYELIVDNVEPLPESPQEEKYVYIAYLKHPRTGTELPLSATTPEGLDTKVRGHMGYEVLAKKRIKFNLGQ